MKNYALTILCCITLVAVLIDLYESHSVARAQSGKRVYVDQITIQEPTPGAVTTRGGTVVGFSCAETPNGRPSCFVLSE